LLQALAAAAMAPQALASVHALFPAHERGRALSIYGVTLGFSSIAGQLLGGALVVADLGGFGWRLIFLVNLPVAIGAFVAAIPLLRDTRGATRPRLDFVGVVLSAAALTALVLPLIEGRELGWPWWTIACCQRRLSLPRRSVAMKSAWRGAAASRWSPWTPSSRRGC
jgi:MFS family permease